MEIADRRVKKEKKHPRIPIKTYKWEEVKRSRRRGGYPWTHLYKEPINDHLDPEPWTMEGMRKAKSSSTMGKSQDFSISEVSTFDNRSSIEEILDNPSLDIKDKNHSIKTSCSSLNLEEQEIEDDIEGTYEVIDKAEAENQNPGMFFLHSEESSDDISQYLDKEERGPTETLTNKDKSAEEDRLKPEDESSHRKRKLSAESKLSLGKRAILEKLRDTKDKIRMPKISFPTKLKKPILKKPKTASPEIKPKIPKPQSPSQLKDAKPVYIHIPLKPAAGETDEFSYLENEASENKSATQRPSSFKNLVKNIKHLQEPKIEHKQPSPIREIQEDESEENTNKRSDEITTPMITEEYKDDGNDLPEMIKSEEIIIVELKEDSNPDRAVEAMEIQEITEEPEENIADSSDTKATENQQIENEFFDKLFEASSSRSRSRTQNGDRKIRSRSAEPDRKRKLSLESSYSRKSLSKLGLLKKLRDAKDKIKNTLSRATSKKDIKAKEEPVQTAEKTQTQTKTKSEKKITPVYIHIPLKPPEGHTDEYSHLEHEAKPSEPVVAPAEPETVPSTPDSPIPANGDVQLIILTAPSDDEILDYNNSDVPETPLSENKTFFPVKMQELKELAKGAVDEITATSTLKKLSPVLEETINPKSSLENIARKISDEGKSESIMVDEEDGLNETKKQESTVDEAEVAINKDIEEIKDKIIKVEDNVEQNKDKLEKVNDELEESKVSLIETEDSQKLISEEAQATPEEKTELKSSLKNPSSPIMKKKVSFKRKSKSKDGSIEERTPIETGHTKPDDSSIRNIAAMDVDDVKIDLKEDIEDNDDTDQKHGSKWSKISDHDHEPVHLSPPNNIEITPATFHNTPAVVISAAQTPDLPDQNYDSTAKHVYEEIPENNSKRSPTTGSRSSEATESSEKPKEVSNKFQAAFKQKADNFKTKLQNIKRPHINLPERPKFHKPNLQRFKIEKPKWNMPKIPDTAKINLPSFSLPRRGGKKTVKRISSTESTSGDSKKPIFDFGTYPRMFKKKSKQHASSDFGTVPRTKTTDASKSTEDSRDSRRSATDSIRIPLHSEDSMDKDEFSVPADSNDLTQPSHIRYDEGIDSEDEYDKENRELMEERDFLSRWQRGRFNPDEFMEEHKLRVTDLDSPEEKIDEFSSNNGKERYSSGSSVGVRRQGVIEEINPDEFFLRQKGISQDNIEVGMYLSTEIREAFRNPTNALVQMGENNFDKGSHHSLPEIQSKRKPKKPKRKKTPHASQEKIPYGEEETPDEELGVPPPSRPKRLSKRKRKTNGEFIPYQETIQVEPGEERLLQHRESLGILADDEQDFMYENEIMEGIDQPEIKITNPYKNYGEDEEEEEEDEEIVEEEVIQEYIPEAPPRKAKSIRSLKTFEIGSAIRTFDKVKTYPSHQKVPERISYHAKYVEPEGTNLELNITQPEFGTIEEENNLDIKNDDFKYCRYMDESIEELPPPAPPRRQKSLKSLTISENESFIGDLNANRAIFSSEKNLDAPQMEAIRTESKVIIPIDNDISPSRPSRSRSRGNSKSRNGSRAASESGASAAVTESINSNQDLDSLHADSLATDNLQPCVEEPCVQTTCDYMGYSTVDRNKPREPPLPPPRSLQRKKKLKKDQDNKFFTVPRTRGSTDDKDVPIRPTRIYSTLGPPQKADIDNKENLEIDIMQYIEPDDSRDLQSGEIIEKIKTRPLPAPPRPPRKPRPLSDITSKENIMIDQSLDMHKSPASEIEVYTQTEPLPDDFVCEEVIQEPTDRIIIPSQVTEARAPRVKRSLITPTVFNYEETITHASLLVEPLNGTKILPDSDFTQRSTDKVVPVHVESDIEETSSIPEEFQQLSNPKESKPPISSEMEVLKAQKLQVTDLDVDTLTVNKLLATKIVVSEIDSGNIRTNEISSTAGALKVGDISLPPDVLDQIIKTIQAKEISEEMDKPKDETMGQKKTPIEVGQDVEPDVLRESPSKYLAQPETSEDEMISNASLPEIEDNEIPIEANTPPVEETVSKEPLALENEEIPPEVPLRIEEITDLRVEESPQAPDPPHRPPRQSERFKLSQSNTELSLQEPEVDDEPPPRPPQPPVGYIPSQPPSSFYALRAQKYVDDNIPVVPRRRRQAKSKQMSRSTSEESSELPQAVRRHQRRTSEPTIAQLSGQLVRACGSEANNALKRLITYILNNVFHNEDGKQDLNVMIIIVLVLIAGLLLLGYGEERTVVHLHHWEYFNPLKICNSL